MPFTESKTGGKIEKKETPKDDLETIKERIKEKYPEKFSAYLESLKKPGAPKKDIDLIKKELKEKYPETWKLSEQKIETLRKYTEQLKEKYEQQKEKYPGLLELLDYLKKSARDAGFKEVLISERGTMLGARPLFNLIRISEPCLPTIKKLREFAPDFLDKALKHTFGNIKEKISGHEREHLEDIALKIYPKEQELSIKRKKALMGGRTLESIIELIRLADEIEKLEEKGEFYAELQRISKQRILEHPERKERAKEVVEAIALPHIFWSMLDLGIEEVLEKEVDKEDYLKVLSESPDKESTPGLYPYLKKEIISEVVERREEIMKDLKQKYEEKYGKIEKGEDN